MASFRRVLRGTLLPLLLVTAPETVEFDIPAQSAASAVNLYAEQARVQVLFPYDVLAALRANRVQGTFDKGRALQLLLEGTGLESVPGQGGTIVIRRRGDKLL